MVRWLTLRGIFLLSSWTSDCIQWPTSTKLICWWIYSFYSVCASTGQYKENTRSKLGPHPSSFYLVCAESNPLKHTHTDTQQHRSRRKASSLVALQGLSAALIIWFHWVSVSAALAYIHTVCLILQPLARWPHFHCGMTIDFMEECFSTVCAFTNLLFITRSRTVNTAVKQTLWLLYKFNFLLRAKWKVQPPPKKRSCCFSFFIILFPINRQPQRFVLLHCTAALYVIICLLQQQTTSGNDLVFALICQTTINPPTTWTENLFILIVNV